LLTVFGATSSGCVPADGSRRALLISGSIGMGHDVMAHALTDVLARRSWTSSTLDAMALLGGRQHKAGEAVFRGMLAVPGAFDALHFHALRNGTRVAELLDDQAARRMAPRIESLLRQAPADLVVSIFATAASAMSRVRAAGVAARTVTLCTDVNPHRLWVHPHTDAYLVPSATSAAFIRRFEPEATVIVAPAPVRAPFYMAPPRETARAQLGVPADAAVALLMGGAWGLGPLVTVARALAAEGVHTLAVAGGNLRTEQALRALAATDSRITPFGFTDQIATLMSAADVVVTTAGDTCTEARTIGRRMVLLDVIAGHGRENLQHELELGNAAVASTEPGLLVRAVRRELAFGDDPAAVDTRPQWEAALDSILSEV
jgi:processive 1,2-diacylglycerol beta-glucosyltransferase